MPSGSQGLSSAAGPFPCGSRPAWLLPSPGQFRTGRSPACLQRMDDGRNHRHVRASADPDSDAFGFDLDAPDIRLGLASRCLALMASNRDGAMASTTAGTNCGSSAIGAGCRRACRRQVNTCCGVSPCRRAISETTAPGTSVSSTIRALSSLENQRRRPVSVITSSRRAVTSDLSVWSSIDTSRSLQRDRETRLSHVPREGGSGTAPPLIRLECISTASGNPAAHFAAEYFQIFGGAAGPIILKYPDDQTGPSSRPARRDWSCVCRNRRARDLHRDRARHVDGCVRRRRRRDNASTAAFPRSAGRAELLGSIAA